jgi:tetratricopeptide (TPR) repeat protein
VGRVSDLTDILAKLDPNYQDDCQRVAITGLGGIGKTQIALEVAFQIQTIHPDCSVFWVPAIDTTTFERAFQEIGQKLHIAGIDEDKADVKSLVKTSLSQESAGRWLMVIDNADDMGMLYDKAEKSSGINGSSRLLDYLPFSRKGSILFTTRDGKAAVKQDMFTLKEMSESDSLKLLKTSLKDPSLLGDTIAAQKLLNILASLPLAIKQAAAFINENTISISGYLEICESNEDQFVELLRRDFEDKGRYKTTTAIKNPIALTWLISFRQILTRDPLAADYLFFMSCVAQQDIPGSLLQPAPKLGKVEALGTLKAYSFLTPREDGDSFDIHRLVHLAARNWLRMNGTLGDWVGKTLHQLAISFPHFLYDAEAPYRYEPHAKFALDLDNSFSANAGARADLLHKVAYLHWAKGEYETADNEAQESLRIREKLLGKAAKDTLLSVHLLAEVKRNLFDFELAEGLIRRALDGFECVCGTTSSESLECLNTFVDILRDQAKYEVADQLLRPKIEQLGGHFAGSIVDILRKQAMGLQDLGKLPESLLAFRTALQRAEEWLGGENMLTLECVSQMAGLLQELGQLEEAEKMSRRALDGFKHCAGMSLENVWALDSRYQLAGILESGEA